MWCMVVLSQSLRIIYLQFFQDLDALRVFNAPNLGRDAKPSLLGMPIASRTIRRNSVN